MNNIGNRIKKLREKNKLTQEELGEKLFFTNKTISSWENNRTTPDLDSICKLSEILNCNISYLLYGETTKNNIETSLKFKINESDYLKIKNNVKKEAKFITEKYEIDTYYNTNNKHSWLRIREIGNNCFLSYKKSNDNYYNKYEVIIDNSNNLNIILLNLNHNIIAKVNKKRIIYRCQNKYEIRFDKVENLGLFIELEILNYEKSSKEEYNNLINLAKHFDLNLKNIETKKYPELITRWFF
mgnify:CR=1 FL=1